MKKQISALTGMFLGAVLVFLAVILINRLSQLIQQRAVQQASSISVQKRAPAIARQRVKKPKPERRPHANRITAPITSLQTALSGIDLGLPQFNANDLNDIGDDLLGDNQNVIMTDSTVDQPPHPEQQAPIAYPPTARSKGIEGYVVLSLLITPSGRVEKVKVLDAQPAGIFDAVARTGIMNWTFQPALYRGVPVKVWARQKISFDLSS